jgi:hypothetical protein
MLDEDELLVEVQLETDLGGAVVRLEEDDGRPPEPVEKLVETQRS